MIVVDSNVIAYRHISGSRTATAERVEQKDPVWIVPRLWRYEFQNILAAAVKTSQLKPLDAVHQWTRVAAALSANETEASPGVVMELVARHKISAYDAQFVALALEKSLSCITEDSELLAKFPGLAVSMDEFLRPPPGMVRETRKRRYKSAP